jgi:hypothetical protein
VVGVGIRTGPELREGLRMTAAGPGCGGCWGGAGGVGPAIAGLFGGAEEDAPLGGGFGWLKFVILRADSMRPRRRSIDVRAFRRVASWLCGSPKSAAMLNCAVLCLCAVVGRRAHCVCLLCGVIAKTWLVGKPVFVSRILSTRGRV